MGIQLGKYLVAERREGGREGGRERGREGGREGGRERGREGGRIEVEEVSEVESLGTRLYCTNYFNYSTTYHIGNGIAWLLEIDQDLKCLILAIV